MKTHWLIPCALFLMHIQDVQGNAKVKLLDGAAKGVVAIQYNGTWTILKRQFNYRSYDQMMNAFVICRMLGFNKATMASRSFGHDNDTRYPYELYCNGEETNIDQCSHYRTSKGVYNAYVKCDFFSQAEKNAQARLVKNDHTYGVVELKEVGGNWSRVCPDSISDPAWDTRDAAVVCRMLGYKGALGATLVRKPRNSGKDFILKKFHCRGDEKTVGECAYSTKYSYPCPQSGYYAGAFCQNDTSSSFEIRLIGSGKPNRGEIQIKYHGVWGTICPTNLEPYQQIKEDICLRLGYLNPYRYSNNFEANAPETSVSFKYNIACDSQGKCGNDVNVTLRSKKCYGDQSLECRVGYPVRFSVTSGCAPELIINQTGLTDREKSLITYYEVNITKINYDPKSKTIHFYIPSNLTNITLGDGEMYEKGQNMPLENEKYWIQIRTVYKGKDGVLLFGDGIRVGDKEFTKTLECGPTTTSVPVTWPRNTDSVRPTSGSVVLSNTIGTTIAATVMYMMLLRLID